MILSQQNNCHMSAWAWITKYYSKKYWLGWQNDRYFFQKFFWYEGALVISNMIQSVCRHLSRTQMHLIKNLPRKTRNNVGGFPLLGCCGTNSSGTLLWYTAIRIQLFQHKQHESRPHSTQVWWSSHLRASAPNICSRGIQPSMFIKSNQWPRISKQIRMSQRLHPKTVLVNQLIRQITTSVLVGRFLTAWMSATDQISSWWKPSSHKKPLGKNGRLGTAE